LTKRLARGTLPSNLTAKYTTRREPMEYTGKHVIVRADRAGVFAGEIESIDGSTVKLKDARRIWYWAGAASLSELAMRGTSKPKSCKFPCAVASMIVFGVIEIIPTTEQAQKSMAEVPEWKG
jgi:hypothetical protein